MKKIKFIIIVLSLLLLTSCNNNDKNSLKLKTDENFILSIKKEINEPIELIEIVNQIQKLETEKKEYKILLKDRNIEFLAYQSIENQGPRLWYDTGRLWDDYKYIINYDDYFYAIRKSKHEDICKLANKFNIEVSDEYEVITLANLEEETITNAYNFLVEVQNIYNYKNNKNTNHREKFSIQINLNDIESSIKDKQNNIFVGDYDIITFKQDYKNSKNFNECINNTYENNLQYLENLYKNENATILGE